LFGSDDQPTGIIEEIVNGVAKPVATIHKGKNIVPINAIAFAKDGTLWGVTGLPGQAQTLGIIHLNTGRFTPVLSIPTTGQAEPFVTGIAISSNGTLYGFSENEIPPDDEIMFTFDTKTKTLLSEQSLNSDYAIGDVTCASNGFIYATNYSYALLKIDLKTHTVTNGSVGDLGSIAAVPETAGGTTAEFNDVVASAQTDRISGSSTIGVDLRLATKATAGSQDIRFAGMDGTLDLTDPTSFYGEISEFAARDMVELLGSWAFSGFSENSGGTLATLTLVSGTTTHPFDFVGDYTQVDFKITSGATSTITHT
jgi:hypothetical protein